MLHPNSTLEQIKSAVDSAFTPDIVLVSRRGFITYDTLSDRANLMAFGLPTHFRDTPENWATFDSILRAAGEIFKCSPCIEYPAID